MLIDSHAHLDDKRFADDFQQVVERALDVGVGHIVNIGVDLETSLKAVQLADKYEMMFAAVGVHPHNASRYTVDTTGKLSSLSGHKKVVAIGEIGLDYYRNLSPRKAQQRVFREQLALARDLNLPVIIHDRDAHQDVLDILVADGLPKAYGVMHCFSGDWEFAERCMKLGLYISFAGPVTFRNAKNLIEVAVKVPLERVLVETDCPYLSPEPHRGKRNEPAYVKHTAAKIASLKGLDHRIIIKATADNTRNLFYKMKRN